MVDTVKIIIIFGFIFIRKKITKFTLIMIHLIHFGIYNFGFVRFRSTQSCCTRAYNIELTKNDILHLSDYHTKQITSQFPPKFSS
jgi:hypothetical protein